MTQQRKTLFNPKSIKRGLDIGAIISAPLVAAASANSMMLKEQTRFLMDFCFTQKGNNQYEPVLIEMSITRSVIEPSSGKNETPIIRRIESKFSLPLLTILPINSLAVDNVTVDFNLEITSQSSVDANDSNVNTSNFGASGEKTQMNGKISYDSKEQANSSNKSQKKTQNSSKLQVHVNAGPLPLPVGVSTLLDLYVKSIQPLPTTSEA